MLVNLKVTGGLSCVTICSHFFFFQGPFGPVGQKGGVSDIIIIILVFILRCLCFS